MCVREITHWPLVCLNLHLMYVPFGFRLYAYKIVRTEVLTWRSQSDLKIIYFDHSAVIMKIVPVIKIQITILSLIFSVVLKFYIFKTDFLTIQYSLFPRFIQTYTFNQRKCVILFRSSHIVLIMHMMRCFTIFRWNMKWGMYSQAK